MKPYYEEPGIQIYHGDCREVLASFPECFKMDLVLTDPPYGVTQNAWDNTAAVFEVLDKLTWPLVCTSQQPFSAALVTRYLSRFKWSDVWEKTQAVGFLNAKIMPLRKHEDILVFCDGRMQYTPQITKKPKLNIRPHGDTAQSTNYGAFSEKRTRTIALDETYPQSIVRFANSQEGQHPTQKPIELFSYLVATYSLAGQSILDPFMGSGTTLRAAKDLGRKAIGIEIEEKYCEIAAKRMSQSVFDFSGSELVTA